MKLHTRWQGSIALTVSPVGKALTTTMVHTENNHAKAVGSLTLSPVNTNVRLTYFIRKPGDNDSITEMSVQMSTYGINPAISMDRRLSRYSRVSCSLHFSFPSCLLYTKFKLKAGQSTFEWQLILCDDKDSISRSFLYGAAVPFITFQLVKVVFRPWWERFKAVFDDTSREQEVDVAKKEEAANVVNLMRATADRIKKDEEGKLGIVIETARYGQCDASGSRAYPVAGERTIDVAVPLQAMVNDSQLRVYAIKVSCLSSKMRISTLKIS